MTDAEISTCVRRASSAQRGKGSQGNLRVEASQIENYKSEGGTMIGVLDITGPPTKSARLGSCSIAMAKRKAKRLGLSAARR